jgi:hypothetical protein
MAKKKINSIKHPEIQIDKSLEKYVDMPLFQEKVEKANKMLRTIGLPKELYKN